MRASVCIRVIVFMRARASVHVRVRVFACVYVRTCARVRACMRVIVCMHSCACVCMRAYARVLEGVITCEIILLDDDLLHHNTNERCDHSDERSRYTVMALFVISLMRLRLVNLKL